MHIEGLTYGTYAYEILPFTQYGYEYDFVQKGTFEVLETLVNGESSIELLDFYWHYTDNDFTLNFTSDLDTGDPANIVTDAHMELYDVWSNASYIFDVTPAEGFTQATFAETFHFNQILKSTSHTKSSGGSIFGVPYSYLTNTTIAKLPTLSTNYNEKVEFIDNTTLRKNHFYIMAIYYTYTIADTNEIINKGIFRYVYTNDAFETDYDNGITDFSFLDYPEQNINLSLNNTTHTLSSDNSSSQIETSTLLYDPLLQEYNDYTKSPSNKILKPYAVGPENYWDTTVVANQCAKQSTTVVSGFSSDTKYDYTLD